MWIRGIVGVVLLLAGAVWIAQGTGAMHGSGMSGHGQYAVLGVVVIVIGLVLLVWTSHVRRSRARQTARSPVRQSRLELIVADSGTACATFSYYPSFSYPLNIDRRASWCVTANAM
ncbi:MAG TPA: hypothetical protein VNE42_00065 [Acidimicrobiales bacterium]|nr:hypothetical protein [Acidimicrobiales bacterium]